MRPWTAAIGAARRAAGLLVAAIAAPALTTATAALVGFGTAGNFEPRDWPALLYFPVMGVGYGALGAAILLAPWLAAAEWRQRSGRQAREAWPIAGALAGVTYAALAAVLSRFDSDSVTAIHTLFGTWPAAAAFQRLPEGAIGAGMTPFFATFLIAAPFAGLAAGWLYGRIAFGKGLTNRKVAAI